MKTAAKDGLRFYAESKAVAARWLDETDAKKSFFLIMARASSNE
jgi:hypothetical protein